LVILVLPLSWWSGLGSAFKTQPRASFDQWLPRCRGHRCIAEIDVVSCRPARKILLIALNNWNNARSQGAILGCSNTSWHHRPSHTRAGFEDGDDTLFVWAFSHLGLSEFWSSHLPVLLQNLSQNLFSVVSFLML
jgi:hypothetical protein